MSTRPENLTNFKGTNNGRINFRQFLFRSRISQVPFEHVAAPVAIQTVPLTRTYTRVQWI